MVEKKITIRFFGDSAEQIEKSTEGVSPQVEKAIVERIEKLKEDKFSQRAGRADS